MISKVTEEHSKRIYWLLQTIFAFLIGLSFHNSSKLFIGTIDSEIIAVSIAILSVYSLATLSWIDFSYTLIRTPYLLKSTREKVRFITDLLIVALFGYLFNLLERIGMDPKASIVSLLSGYCLVYVAYFLSGIFRIWQYGNRVSRSRIIVAFMLIFFLVAIIYSVFFPGNNPLYFNTIFLIVTLTLTIAHPIISKILGKRKYRIAIDVDGVLANQIHGILPVIKKELGIELKYDDVNNWKFQLNDTSIDKVIANEQKHRNYILNMPVHNGAQEAISQLIKKHYVSIATARPIETDQWTREWLIGNQIPFDTYHNMKEGLKHNEAFDLLIDDYPGNIISFLNKHDGVAILFSQPWNQDLMMLQEYIDNRRLYIARTWNEIPMIIKNILH